MAHIFANNTKNLTDKQRFPNILIERIEDGKIWIIKIDRANRRNAIDPVTGQELAQAFTEFDNDKNSKVAIFTGVDEYFCAGYDLQALAVSGQNKEQIMERIMGWNKFSSLAPMGVSRLFLSKPVIGAVQGFAVAGGLEMALWCDMLVSHPEATFGVFCRRFGVPLMDGGTVRLQKVVGYNRAKDMVLTGRRVSGKEAYDWGLVNRLVDKKQVQEEAINLAHQIMQHPENCMRSDRKALHHSTYHHYEQDILNEIYLGLQTMLTGETLKGAMAFSFDKKGRHGTFTEKSMSTHNKPKL